MRNIWGNPLERCNDWVHYSVFSPHTVIVFSITKSTWQLQWQIMPGCQSHIHQMFRSKKCIKNDHDSLTDFQDSAIWMDFGRKTISQWLGCSWLIMTGKSPLREFEGLGCSRRMSKTICWLSWTSGRMGEMGENSRVEGEHGFEGDTKMIAMVNMNMLKKG